MTACRPPGPGPTVRLGACAPADYAALEQTLDLWLRPAGPRLGLEYPLLFRPSPDLLHLTARGPEGAFLAHAALLQRRILGGGIELPVAMLSCVAARPGARGLGLGSRIVSHALEQARARGAALALLWSDRESFYGRLGFRRSGRELVVRLDSADFPGAWPEPVAATAGHLPGLLALRERTPVRMARSAEEWARLLAIPRLETYLLPGAAAPSAYLCLGKGLDFPEVVHELCGEPAAVEALLGGLLARRPGRSLGLLLSPLDEDLARALRARGSTPSEGALGLCAVLDWNALERFTAALGPLAAPFRGPAPYLPFHLGGLDSV